MIPVPPPVSCFPGHPALLPPHWAPTQACVPRGIKSLLINCSALAWQCGRNPIFQRLGQEDWELWASLGYMVNPKLRGLPQPYQTGQIQGRGCGPGTKEALRSPVTGMAAPAYNLGAEELQAEVSRPSSATALKQGSVK